MNEEVFYSVAELERNQMLGYKNRRTIVKMIESGELKAKKRHDGNGTRYRVSTRSIMEFLNTKC